jgi:hypothetical protein
MPEAAVAVTRPLIHNFFHGGLSIHENFEVTLNVYTTELRVDLFLLFV